MVLNKIEVTGFVFPLKTAPLLQSPWTGLTISLCCRDRHPSLFLLKSSLLSISCHNSAPPSCNIWQIHRRKR